MVLFRGMLFIFLVLWFFHIPESSCFAQDAEVTAISGVQDARKEIEQLLSLSKKFSASDYQKTINYAAKALNLATNLDDKKSKYAALQILSDIYLELENYPKALEYQFIANDEASALNDRNKKAYTFSMIGYIYYNFYDYGNSLKYYDKALSIYKQAGKKENEGEVLHAIGSIYDDFGKYEKALEYYLGSLSIKENLGDSIGIASLMNNMGILYKNIKEYKLSLNCYMRSLNIREIYNDKPGIAQCYMNIGVNYQQAENISKSNEYFLKSQKIYKETSNHNGEAKCYLNLGVNYESCANFKKAEEYYQQALEMFRLTNDLSSVSLSYMNLGNINIKLSNYGRAEEFLKKGLNFAKEENLRSLLAQGYMCLSDLYSFRKDYFSAAKYHNLYKAINDSIYAEHARKLIADMQVKYETDKRIRENKILKMERDTKSLQLEVQNRTNMLLLSLAAFVSVSIALLFGMYRQKKNLNNQLNEKNHLLTVNNQILKTTNNDLESTRDYLVNLNKTKDKFFSIIAHDLRNPFTSLMVCVELFKRYIEKIDKEQLERLMAGMSTTITTANDLLGNLLEWSRTQTSTIEFVPAKFLLDDVVRDVASLIRSHAYQKNIEIVANVSSGVMVLADKNMVNSILRNLLTNAVKFSYSGSQVYLDITNHDTYAEISVKDSGVGIPEKDIEKLFRIDTKLKSQGTANEGGTGLGLILCKEFVEKNNGTISVSSIEGKGTTFSFTLPTA